MSISENSRFFGNLQSQNGRLEAHAPIKIRMKAIKTRLEVACQYRVKPPRSQAIQAECIIHEYQRRITKSNNSIEVPMKRKLSLS